MLSFAISFYTMVSLKVARMRRVKHATSNNMYKANYMK